MTLLSLYLIGSELSFRSFCSSGGIPFHLKNKSQPNPPLWSAFAEPWYANVSAFRTSIAGHTTLERKSAIRAKRGSAQPGVASQCESRNVRTSPLAAWAPFKRARTSPSRLSFRSTVTLLIVATWSSSGLPSLSTRSKKMWTLNIFLVTRKATGKGFRFTIEAYLSFCDVRHLEVLIISRNGMIVKEHFQLRVESNQSQRLHWFFAITHCCNTTLKRRACARELIWPSKRPSPVSHYTKTSPDWSLGTNHQGIMWQWRISVETSYGRWHEEVTPQCI